MKDSLKNIFHLKNQDLIVERDFQNIFTLRCTMYILIRTTDNTLPAKRVTLKRQISGYPISSKSMLNTPPYLIVTGLDSLPRGRNGIPIPLEKFRNLPARERVAGRRNVKRKRMSPIAATATRNDDGRRSWDR